MNKFIAHGFTHKFISHKFVTHSDYKVISPSIVL